MIGWAFWLSLVPTTILVAVLNVLFIVAVLLALLILPGPDHIGNYKWRQLRRLNLQALGL